jgi:two-component system osmolarity sensor histidine kinase EnvZ
MVDILALRRIMTNLMDNALRYGGGKPIEVRCDCDKDKVVLRVLDQGEGIPSDQQEAVFRPFHRLENSRSRATGGSGLGLAIAKQLSDSNHWQIQLLSREDGGTEARLEIPKNGQTLTK